ncbi:hypothetical protein ACFXAW_31495 [Streptomyces sp. NPDC059445]|uniref:hypothetical protein n=1 Tax=Streptomyces sp. NPDC059445 TaxID=3346832 RepID=UPI00369B0B9F
MDLTGCDKRPSRSKVLEVGLLGVTLLRWQTEPDLLALTTVPAEAEEPAVDAAVSDAANADCGQGLRQPAARVDARTRPRSPERDELLLGVLVALLLTADLL